MIPTAVAIFGLAFLISFGATYTLRGYFTRIGFMDEPGSGTFHFAPTPFGGGFAILAGFTIPVFLGLAVAWFVDSPPGFVPDEVGRHLDGIRSVASHGIPILFGGALIFFVGLLDDRFGLTPAQKLLGQVLVAAALAAIGVRVTVFIPNEAFGFVLTVLWAVALMNAFNLLDNCNGLSAGVAAVVSGILLIVAIQTGQWFIAALLLAFLGALLGFLRFNFPKGTIFMGDAGSLLIGYVLAVITILFSFYDPRFATTHWPILLPLLVMAVPLFDTASVVFLRLRSGRPIFQGDHKHLSHRLIAMGMTQTGAVITIWLLTFSTGITATLLYTASLFGCLIILAQSLAVLGLVVLIETRTGGTS